MRVLRESSRNSKILLGNYNLKRSKLCIGPNKNCLCIITGLLTGHCRVRKHITTLKTVEEAEFCVLEDEHPTEVHPHTTLPKGTLFVQNLGSYEIVEQLT